MYITNEKGQLVPFSIYQAGDEDELSDEAASNPYADTSRNGSYSIPNAGKQGTSPIEQSYLIESSVNQS